MRINICTWLLLVTFDLNFYCHFILIIPRPNCVVNFSGVFFPFFVVKMFRYFFFHIQFLVIFSSLILCQFISPIHFFKICTSRPFLNIQYKFNPSSKVIFKLYQIYLQYIFKYNLSNIFHRKFQTKNKWQRGK